MASTNNLTAGQRVGDQTVDNFEVSVLQTTTSTVTGVQTLNAGTGTSTAAAATVNTQVGQITTESLTTAAGATYSFTLTNSLITATSKVFASVGLGTATTGTPCVAYITPGTGSATIVIQNIAAAAALNGTIKINFHVDP